MIPQPRSHTAAVVRRGGVLLLLDAEDHQWIIRDYLRVSGRLLRVRELSPAAEVRLFVPRPGAGEPLAYSFHPADERMLVPDEVVRQFLSAVPVDRLRETWPPGALAE